MPRWLFPPSLALAVACSGDAETGHSHPFHPPSPRDAGTRASRDAGDLRWPDGSTPPWPEPDPPAATGGATGHAGAAGGGAAGSAGADVGSSGSGSGGFPEIPDGWIGSGCSAATDCLVDGSSETCLSAADGWPGGHCSLSCTRLCPDPDFPGGAATFCVEAVPDTGLCVAQCDTRRHGPSGCRSGYVCRVRARFREATVTRPVCVPEAPRAERCTGDEVRLENLEVEVPPGLAGCPGGMTRVGPGLCIDRWEGHLVEVLADGTERAWSPYLPPGSRDVRARSAPGAVPQAYVSAVVAERACRAAGKRLCTEPEWELACRGAERRLFPYGNLEVPGACHGARTLHPAVEYFGTTASWIWSQLTHPCLDQLPGTLAQAGSFPGCVTPEDVYDLVGNLHEWVADEAGTFRGGFYVDTRLNGPGCTYRTTAHDRWHWDYSTGFRCCADG